MSVPTPPGDSTPSGQTTPQPAAGEELKSTEPGGGGTEGEGSGGEGSAEKGAGRSGRGRRKVTELDQDTFRKYARRTGWLLLLLIVSYIGLQLPLPYRLLAVLAGLAGVVGGALLLISCFRKRLPALMHVSAIAAVLCCAVFTFTGGAQALFWGATTEFDQCRVQALTERSMNQCYLDYEENMLSSVPGMG